MPVVISIAVYPDSVSVTAEQAGHKMAIGCFEDEIDGLAAACEQLIEQSAIMPGLRRLPELCVRCEYRTVKTSQLPERFHRGLRPRLGAHGERRMVKVPWADAREFLGKQAVA